MVDEGGSPSYTSAQSRVTLLPYTAYSLWPLRTSSRAGEPDKVFLGTGAPQGSPTMLGWGQLEPLTLLERGLTTRLTSQGILPTLLILNRALA